MTLPWQGQALTGKLFNNSRAVSSFGRASPLHGEGNRFEPCTAHQKGYMNGIYSEDGWEAVVDILEDTSDKGWDRYKLKVIRTIRESPIFKTPEDGSVFSVDQLKGCCFGGMWHLEKGTDIT